MYLCVLYYIMLSKIYDDMYNLSFNDLGIFIVVISQYFIVDTLQDSWTLFTVGSAKLRVQRPCDR